MATSTGHLTAVDGIPTDLLVVSLANATHHGLVAYLYTRELSRAFRVADAVETGMVSINRGLVSNAAAPFGGTKQSGLAREGSREGVEAYTESKYLAVAP